MLKQPITTTTTATTTTIEIKVISAQDLPPVSRILRTYAVACLDKENVAQTAVDRRGGTNPTWNHKMVFCVDDKFLHSKTSEIRFDIYNVAWLRDLPIGSATLPVSSVVSRKTASSRSVALRLRRPTGHLHGILNVVVQLKGNNNNVDDNNNKISKTLSMNHNDDDVVHDVEYQIMPKEPESNNTFMPEDEGDEEQDNEDHGCTQFVSTHAEDQHYLHGLIMYVENENDNEDMNLKSKESSGVHRLSLSEIPAGDYWGRGDNNGDDDDDNYGDYIKSSILETWNVQAEGDEEDERERGTKSLDRWRMTTMIEEGEIPATMKDKGDRKIRRSNRQHHRRSKSDNGVGLFSLSLSCMKSKFICGSSLVNKKKIGPSSRRRKMVGGGGGDDHTVAIFPCR